MIQGAVMLFLRRFLVAFLVVMPLFLVACLYRPPRVEMKGLNPSSHGSAAVQQYDQDGNGTLSKVELAQCPGILKAIDLYDLNKDGEVTSSEIADRINLWKEHKTASMTVSCSVMLNGRQLDGGKVEFAPEEFFGGKLHPASGEIQGGYAMVFVDPSLLPPDQADLQGVHPGVYKVKITHPTIQIPAKYNTETTLGQEVALDNPDMEALQFDLSTR
jgi:hypothetical protein